MFIFYVFDDDEDESVTLLKDTIAVFHVVEMTCTAAVAVLN